MKKYILALTVMAFMSTTVFAIVKPLRRDIKPASQVMLEKQTISDAVIADPNRLLSNQATSASVITTVTSFLAQPDVGRALSITPGGTTADVPAGNIVITGVDMNNNTMSETFTLSANESSIQNGVLAFLSVTSIVFPIQDGADATYDIGVIDVLGLKRCMFNAGQLAWTVFDGAFETTRATAVADNDEIEKNTINFDGTLDGAKDGEVYFLQTFECLP